MSVPPAAKKPAYYLASQVEAYARLLEWAQRAHAALARCPGVVKGCTCAWCMGARQLLEAAPAECAQAAPVFPRK